MKEIVKMIQALPEEDLQEVMLALQEHYTKLRPEMEMFFVVVHRETALRRTDYEGIWQLMRRELADLEAEQASVRTGSQ